MSDPRPSVYALALALFWLPRAGLAAASTPYDPALAALKSGGAAQLKELDALLLRPGDALLEGPRAAALLREHEAALALFRQAAQRSSDGYLFGPKRRDSTAPDPAYGDHLTLFRLLLLDAKLKTARRQTSAAEQDLLAAVGFLGQLYEQKSGALIAMLAGQFCLQKAYPLLGDSLRASASAAYLGELSARLDRVARAQDGAKAAFLEEGERFKAHFRQTMTPETAARERAKLPFMRQMAARRLQDAEFFSLLFAKFDAANDEQMQAVIEAFRANEPGRLPAFGRKREEDLLARQRERDRVSEWSKFKDALSGGAALKEMMAEALIDNVLLIASPAYEKLVPRYHVSLCSLSVLRAALAVKLYQRGHKGLPPEELSQAYPEPQAVPRDSFDGFRPLRYVRRKKRFFLYSFGPDGKDGGGSSALDWGAYLDDPDKDSGDIVFAD